MKPDITPINTPQTGRPAFVFACPDFGVRAVRSCCGKAEVLPSRSLVSLALPAPVMGPTFMDPGLLPLRGK